MEEDAIKNSGHSNVVVPYGQHSEFTMWLHRLERKKEDYIEHSKYPIYIQVNTDIKIVPEITISVKRVSKILTENKNPPGLYVNCQRNSSFVSVVA